MAKVDNIEIHPSEVDDLKRIFKDPVLHIYKTRKGNRDEYRLELTDRKTGIKAEIDTGNEAGFVFKAYDTPDFEDIWVGFKADGLDFDLNIFDLYLYGPRDKDGDLYGSYEKDCGLYATVCTVDENGSTITEPSVYVETHVHYRDESGNVIDFDCDDGSNYLLKLAAWDGSK
jgi:hypothetical protein